MPQAGPPYPTLAPAPSHTGCHRDCPTKPGLPRPGLLLSPHFFSLRMSRHPTWPPGPAPPLKWVGCALTRPQSPKVGLPGGVRWCPGWWWLHHPVAGLLVQPVELVSEGRFSGCRLASRSVTALQGKAPRTRSTARLPGPELRRGWQPRCPARSRGLKVCATRTPAWWGTHCPPCPQRP